MNKRMVDTKIFKILSYVFLLWIIGLLSPYRNDKDVKFHVGQGILLTFIISLLFIVVVAANELLIQNIFVDKVFIGGGESVKFIVNQTGIYIGTILKLTLLGIYIIFDLIGIGNILKGKDKALPIIGKYSFINKILWKRITYGL